ncbi:MAG TPA: hypothetical protein VLA00_01835 [Xanthobacteraceae bacterium]|nr:hypothetical protein [Xanthobacteraceae bacterium]
MSFAAPRLARTSRAVALCLALSASAASAAETATVLAQAIPFAGPTSPSPLPQGGAFVPRALIDPGAGQPAHGGVDPHAVLPQPPPGKASIGMSARFGEGGDTIPRGLVWRVFADKPEASGAYPLVAEAVEPAPVFFLSPGGYVVHVAYGLASAAHRIVVGANSTREQIVVAAGGLKLQSDVNDLPIPAQKVAFDVYEGSFLQGKSSSRPYFRGANSGDLLMLPAGSYHVVSTYGEGNAVIQVDVAVQAGKLTDATIHHRAAQISFRLVNAPGAEGLPDTQWTVLTPGGDTIKESIGAFPVFVLTEGDYVAIARHDGKMFTKEFAVEVGKDRAVEIGVQ